MIILRVNGAWAQFNEQLPLAHGCTGFKEGNQGENGALNLNETRLIIFLVLLVFSSINQVVEHDTEMPRKRGTLRRGRTGGSGARQKENLGSTDGYIT